MNSHKNSRSTDKHLRNTSDTPEASMIKKNEIRSCARLGLSTENAIMCRLPMSIPECN